MATPVQKAEYAHFFLCSVPFEFDKRVPFKVLSRSVDTDLRWPPYLQFLVFFSQPLSSLCSFFVCLIRLCADGAAERYCGWAGE
jgi:hypothetical protein